MFASSSSDNDEVNQISGAVTAIKEILETIKDHELNCWLRNRNIV